MSSSEMEDDPILAQAEAGEVSSLPRTPTSNVGEEINIPMAEDQTLAMEGQDKYQGEKLPSGTKELASDHPVSLARVVLESCDQQATPPQPSAEGGVLSTPLSPLGQGTAELAERQRAVEAALTSSSILPEHH